MQYTEDQIEQLENAYQEAIWSYNDKMLEYPNIPCNDEAKEFLQQGFCRRLKTLKNCIKNIYKIYPPNRSELLEDEEIEAITINIQAFVFNMYGCIDNLCWVLLKEKQIDFTLSEVNFFHEKVRRILPESFKSYLAGKFKEWYDKYCKDFRHSLAHRIPLYVPEGVPNQNIERYQRIPAERWDAIKNRDYDKADELDAEERSLMMNFAVYTHSFLENSGQVPYHIQLIADFNTIIEFADKFFEEFKNNNFKSYLIEKPSFIKKILLKILKWNFKKTKKLLKTLNQQKVI